MIQIRKLRLFTPVGSPEQSSELLLKPNVAASSHQELFLKLETLVETIPPKDRWNIYYTLGQTSNQTKRDWVSQNVIPFDIDGLANEDGHFDETLVLDTVFGVLEVDKNKCIVVASGNGLQILIQVPGEITSREFFPKYRPLYKRLCQDIAEALKEKNIQFSDVDHSAFAANRLFRLPLTENRKKDRPTRFARVLHKTLEPQEFFIKPTDEDLMAVGDKDQVSDKELSSFKVDSPSVESGCNFLKHAKENPQDLREPEWYAMLSVVSRLEDGRDKCHEYSKGHPQYSAQTTDRKVDQALAASGPRTCENINALWSNCHKCPHFEKVKSPISIKGENFIATEKTGFHILSKNGTHIPQYQDLVKYYFKLHPYKVNVETKAIYKYDGKKYKYQEEAYLKNFAHRHFNPKPLEKVAGELIGWMKRENLVQSDWFSNSTKGYINFQNGVFEISTKKLLLHSPDFGFLWCLPYDYDPKATCPTFDKFMSEVTCGDKMLEQTLCEFTGYGICDQDYWIQKSPLLIGEGSNGKSTFLDVVRALSGEENVSSLSITQLKIETSRYMLEGKLFNICEELPIHHFKETELVKNLYGGTTTIRRLFQNPQSFRNTAKMWFAGNQLPATSDFSHGMNRRWVIVPFKASFDLDASKEGFAKADPKILEKMKKELAGIFNRIFDAYLDLVARGRLIEAQASIDELAAYRDDVDSIGLYIKENLQWESPFSVNSPYTEFNVLFERYVSDCKRNEEKIFSKRAFFSALKRKISDYQMRISQPRACDQRRVLLGVTFKSDAPSAKSHF